MINVSELVNDMDFAQPQGIKITRSSTTIVNHRVHDETQELTLPGTICINQELNSELEKDGNTNSESIQIFTYKRLKVVGYDKVDKVDYGGDIVHYNNEDYIVTSCKDYEEFGYCKSIAHKINPEVE